MVTRAIKIKNNNVERLNVFFADIELLEIVSISPGLQTPRKHFPGDKTANLIFSKIHRQ